MENTKDIPDTHTTDEAPCPYEQLAREAWESSAEYNGTPWDETDPVESELREKKKDLVILALTDYSRHGDAAVAHAVAVSMIFHAELCILPLLPDVEAHSESLKHSLFVAETHHVPFTWQPYEPQLRRRIHDIAGEINAMMLVMGVSSERKQSFFTRRKALRWILPSRIPVLVVGSALPRPDAYRHIILPLDTSVYSKEKALWAGYFHRFYHANIHLLYKEYKDKYLAQKLKANLLFTEKIYGNLDIPSTAHPQPDGWEEIEGTALRFAPEIQASLMVCMTTRYPTPIDLLSGRREKHWMRHADEMPFLFINQRDDLYVLCT